MKKWFSFFTECLGCLFNPLMIFAILVVLVMTFVVPEYDGETGCVKINNEFVFVEHLRIYGDNNSTVTYEINGETVSSLNIPLFLVENKESCEEIEEFGIGE